MNVAPTLLRVTGTLVAADIGDSPTNILVFVD